ncbi:glycine--tRNA ligase [Candidatus Woesearchaeota archaeon]|nr:glycine--tRNA ligase [Candidatus Woesearchaeota archaeon]
MATYEDVINLALRRSFFYPSSDIYANAPAGFYSYGPYGTAIRRALIEQWRRLLLERTNMLEIDSAITMPEDVFKSSGHLASFADPITECVKCESTYRADQLLTDHTEKEYKEAQSDEELTAALVENKLKCGKCGGALGPVKRSSLMVKADVGVAKKTNCYLRPETCQGIFCDFAKLYKTMRVKLPQGIAQVGKAFRNEISPRQTLLRQVEFYQMEAEVFFNPREINDVSEFDAVRDTKLNIQLADQDKPKIMTAGELVEKKIVSGTLVAHYLALTQQLMASYGLALEHCRFRQLDEDERAFYAKEGWDFEVQSSVGWLELIANNYRTDYDLKGHQEGSGTDLTVLDEETNNKYIPHVWEISIGLDRTFYAVLEHAYNKDDKRMWLSLPAVLAPRKVAVFPLLSNKPPLVEKAKEVQKVLLGLNPVLDTRGSIGKRYARSDEIGIPVCVTIDFDTLEDETVTVRERDTTEQKRVPIQELWKVLEDVLVRAKRLSTLQ